MLAEIGLILIIIGLIFQLKFSWKGKKEIKKEFLYFYALGVLLLVIDGFMNKLSSLAILNLGSLIVAIIILLRLKR